MSLGNSTEYIMVIRKNGELVDILSDTSATGVMIQAAERGYSKSAGYDMPDFPELQHSEGARD